MSDIMSDIRNSIQIVSRCTLSELKKLAYSPDKIVRLAVEYSPNATEEVKLMAKAYDKFRHLIYE